MSGQLLTADQLAERWQVPKSQVYRLAREGRIPTVEIGRYYRFRLDAIDAWENRTVDVGASTAYARASTNCGAAGDYNAPAPGTGR